MTLLFPLPGCHLARVARDGPAALTIVAEAKYDHACYPTCRTVSTSVHRRYRRRPADLPASGKAVRLQLAVRRFYCRDPACPRTFGKRFAKLLARHAQRTRRLADAQARTGLGLGAQPAARLLAHLAMPASATTLLRAIRSLPLPSGETPRVVGVDNCAVRKGRTYGTIVIDLERRRSRDLLLDRLAGTLAAWLRRQLQILIVAGDRSTEYARGAARTAPTMPPIRSQYEASAQNGRPVPRNARSVISGPIRKAIGNMTSLGGSGDGGLSDGRGKQ